MIAVVGRKNFGSGSVVRCPLNWVGGHVSVDLDEGAEIVAAWLKFGEDAGLLEHTLLHSTKHCKMAFV